MFLLARLHVYTASFLLVSYLVGGAPVAKTRLSSRGFQDRTPDIHVGSACQLTPQQAHLACETNRIVSTRESVTSMSSVEGGRAVVPSEPREGEAWTWSAPVLAKTVRREEEQGKKKSDKSGIWIIVAIAVIFALIVVALLYYHWRNIKRACGGFWKRSRQQSEGKHLRGRVENRDPADYVPLVAGLKIVGAGVDIAGP